MFLDRDRFVAQIDTGVAAAALFAPHLVGLARERLCVAHLDRDLRLLHLMVCPLGEAHRVGMPLRLIVGEALRLETHGLLVGHNHPSGDGEPSAADRRATAGLAQAARLLGIRLLDHLLFAGEEVLSFRALGLL